MSENPINIPNASNICGRLRKRKKEKKLWDTSDSNYIFYHPDDYDDNFIESSNNDE
jgi:hypothetical protein